MARELTVPTSVWSERIAGFVRRVLAPLLFAWSGFFTADFVLSGAYTWPRTSRVFVLTLTLFILSYEFVYQAARTAPQGDDAQAKRLVQQACFIPYAVGILLLLLIVFVRR